MAFGFGFNKAKVLGTAEKFVQQGKLQNAVAEYRKVLKADPKDLTVMNTIGDLYVRLGQTAEAIQCFKTVGQTYAGNGFVVKAIAIYKKLIKLNPAATDCVLKLAELYSQQGLYNDARAHYLSIADSLLRSGDHQQVSLIFHKLLEMDPDNAAMQSKLADFYVKMGDRDKARNLLFAAAESLFRRGATQAAEKAVDRVLALSPADPPAVLLRGQIAAEAGDAEKALQFLEKVPDLDSRPEGLRAALRAHLQMGNSSEALPVASKLLKVHNDLSGIIACGDHLMASGQHETALRLYNQYADRLLADDREGMLAKVASAPAHLNGNADALELVLKLYRKAGDTTHLTEAMELLAHALVQAGELVRARELYDQLAALEPENPAHAQSYKQLSARLGDDPASRPLTAHEGAQALMVDELEIDAPAVAREYSAEVARAVRTALTDSELLDSYNLPSKAIAPLEAALPAAPQDVLLNQRLASLYVRAERYSDAARCCHVLCAVYRNAGHHQLAAQYAELSAKYHERAGEPLLPSDHVDFARPGVLEQVLGSAELGESDSDQVAAGSGTERDAQPVHATTAYAPVPKVDSDISQWEEMTSVEAPDNFISAHLSESPPLATPAKSGVPSCLIEAASAGRAGDVVGELLAEIRFYVSQGMRQEAEAAIEQCAVLAPGIPELSELRGQFNRSTSALAPEMEVVEGVATLEPAVAPVVLDPQTLELEEETSRADLHRMAELAATSGPADSLKGMIVGLEKDLAEEPAFAAPASLPSAAATASVHASPALAPADVPRAVAATTPRSVRSTPSIPVIQAVAAAADPQTSQISLSPIEPRSGLSEIFEEFKGEMEADGGTAAEQDPETHYNLGIAFQEMGLLEEAIGELQKVCHAVEYGQPFAHILQVYTWLAQCLVNKGAPQAAIKWYQQALQLQMDEENRVAVYYEMAAAYQAAGDRKAALENFMEVYANNIDYRDVAERIKTLKA